MKAPKLTFLLLALLTVAACDDDEAPVVCTQADWVGTYTGLANCDGMSTEATVDITANGTEEIAITYELMNTTFSNPTFIPPTSFDGCAINETGGSEPLGITIALDANLTGDELALTYDYADTTFRRVCNLIVTRD